MMPSVSDVRRGVEEVVAGRDADRLQRRSERARAAEQQRGVEAVRPGSSARRSPAPPPSGPGRSRGLRSSCPGSRATGTSRRSPARKPPSAGRQRAHARSRRSPSRAPRPRCRRPCARPGPSACCGTPSRAPNASATPIRNSGFTCSAARICGESLQAPNGIAGKRRRLRLDVGLAEEEREAGAEQHQPDADGDVVDARQVADQAVQQAEQQARAAGGQHAEPRAAAHVRDGVAASSRPSPGCPRGRG